VLHFGSATHCIDDACKFDQHAVAGILNDPVVIFPNLRLDQSLKVHLQPLVGILLVRTHQARIARHIGGEDRGETVEAIAASAHPAPGYR